MKVHAPDNNRASDFSIRGNGNHFCRHMFSYEERMISAVEYWNTVAVSLSWRILKQLSLGMIDGGAHSEI